VAVPHAAKKKSKIILAPAELGVNLKSFWGEQKPVSTLVETGFNFLRDFYPHAHLSLFAGIKNPILANQSPRPKKIKIKNLLASKKPQAIVKFLNRGVEQPGSSSGS
jgi:hypothetical protein